MMNQKTTRITTIANKAASAAILAGLKESGILAAQGASGRLAFLQERTGISRFISKDTLGSEPADVITFLASPEMADAALSLVIQAGRLDEPGRGTAVSDELTVRASYAGMTENSIPAQPASPRAYGDLAGITCIVQRGEGDAVARVALETGTCVPAVLFGIGTGLRDKLGLLRITIPAEKDVVVLLMGRDDAPAVMELMIEAGRLDEPGKGFIYSYELGRGIVNTQVNRGQSRQAASVEQIVAAIDEIKGGMDWRRKSLGEQTKTRHYLTGLCEFILVCNEGRGMDLVGAAMAAGAAGATISKVRRIGTGGGPSPARESAGMIVGEGQISQLVAALEAEGAFDDKSHGVVLTRPASKAFTYIAPK